MFRLIGKDLRILGRSRLLVVTLVLYPLLVALLIGLALSRAPEKPKIAVVDQIPRDVPVTTLAGKVVDPAAVADQLVKNLDAVRVPTRAQAAKLVEDGDVLAAIILPDDINDRLSATINLFGGTPPEIEVLVNGSDPVKARYVESVVDARLADANQTLSATLTKVVASYVTKLVKGGEFTFGPITVDILGLEKSKQRIDTALRALPPGSRVKARLAGGVRVRRARRRQPRRLGAGHRVRGLAAARRQDDARRRARHAARDVRGRDRRDRLADARVADARRGAARARANGEHLRAARARARPAGGAASGPSSCSPAGSAPPSRSRCSGIVSFFVELDWGTADALGARARARRRSRSRRSASRSPCSRATWRPRRCSRSRSRCRSRSSRSSRRTRSAPGSTT